MATRSRRFAAPVRRRQILDVAARRFARTGYAGTTTKEIAAGARVNEAIIFRHFATKEGLYWAILEEKCRSAGGQRQLEARLADCEDERALLVALSEDVFRRYREDRTLTRLLLFSALEKHALARRFFGEFIARSYETLAKHIRRLAAGGVFRRIDPLLAARAFFGMVGYHVLIQEVFGAKRIHKIDPKAASRAFADVWLDGMRSRSARA